jgi:hypothetical protein
MPDKSKMKRKPDRLVSFLQGELICGVSLHFVSLAFPLFFCVPILIGFCDAD